MNPDNLTKTSMYSQPPAPSQSHLPAWGWVLIAGLVLLLLVILLGAGSGLFYLNGKVKGQSATAAALIEQATAENKSAKTKAAAAQNTSQTEISALQAQAEASEKTQAALMFEKEALAATLAAIPPTPTPIPPTAEPTRIPLPSLSFIYRSHDGTNSAIIQKQLGNPGTIELLRLPGNMSGLAWSPDGAQIAFYSNERGFYDIYVMDADGSNLRNLTQSNNVDGDPLWSPDGSKILFSGLPGATYEIYTISVNNGELINLTNNAYNDVEPAWSPDGKWVVYASDHDLNDYYGLYLVDAQGNNRQLLTTETDYNDRNPVFSPDGEWIAFNGWDGDWDILILNIKTNELTNLTQQSTADDWSPVWSPDGTRIAFVSMTATSNANIFVYNLKDNAYVRLTDSLGFDWQPAWTPDGQFISFETDMDGNWEIYLVNLTGDLLINLIESPYTTDGEIGWMPY